MHVGVIFLFWKDTNVETETKDAMAVARALLEIRAPRFYQGTPYRFTSGILSPVYMDCRRLMSFPGPRETVMRIAEKYVREQGTVFDCVAGGETAGIPYAAFLAQMLVAPMIYIRKKPKDFGTRQQIEGEMPTGARVLLVEDLMSDAGSKVNFTSAIEAAGGKVGLLMVIYAYGFAKAAQRLEQMGLACHPLTTCRVLAGEAQKTGYFSKDQVATIFEFLEDPEGWAGKHGL